MRFGDLGTRRQHWLGRCHCSPCRRVAGGRDLRNDLQRIVLFPYDNLRLVCVPFAFPHRYLLEGRQDLGGEQGACGRADQQKNGAAYQQTPATPTGKSRARRRPGIH
jgi:hypothetical protein